MPTSGNLQNQIKDQIKAILIAELGAGKRLSGVKRVGESWQNSLDVYPYVGISPIKRKEQWEASHQKRSTVQWGITVIVKSSGANSSLEAACIARDQLLDDGNGNGVEPVLRDMANLQLGGIVTKIEILEVQYTDNVEADKQASPSSFLAIGVVLLESTQIFSF